MTAPDQSPLGTRHFNELDSLRGLAAITVAIGHLALITFFSNSWIGHPYIAFWRRVVEVLNRTPLAFLMEGGAAVRFFFVLSGFVLMLPFLRRKENPYSPYLVKRICRLYLPYLVAVALGFLGDYFLAQGSPAGFPVRAGTMWTLPITANMIVQHVLLYGSQIGQLDQVLWSLVQEMRISIIYPFIALLVLKVNTRKLVLMVVAIELFLAALVLVYPDTSTSLQSLFSTLHFTTIFIFGAWLAKNHNQLGQRLLTLSRSARVTIALTAFLAYSLGIKFLWGNQLRIRFISPFQHHFPHAWFAQTALVNFIVLALGDWISAICAAVAIIYALHQRQVRSALHIYPVLITGRASYTLYLVHSLVLWALIFALAGTPWFWAVIPGFIVGTILLTWLFYRWVEVPTMNLGRRIAKAMQEKHRQTPTSSVAS